MHDGVLLPWHEEPINKGHDRKGFDCGQSDLNLFLSKYARQSHENGASKTYLAIENGDGKTVLGYYTLSPAQVEFSRVPEIARYNLGRHDVGGFRLGRLAVSTRIQGKGLGGQLLLAAARRCIRASEQVGGTSLLIDAKDEKTAKWYQLFGAVALNDLPLSLMLAYRLLQDALTKAGKL
ncbi:MAG: GNAT family N-acetyltransferase [Polaromonas sp.]